MQVINRPSPNHEPRKNGVKPTMMILHYTGMKTAEEALVRMCDPQTKVSAHYCVDEDGTIYKLVEEDRRAWHAGKSYWAGETDINSHSIGIEIVNPGHEHGYRPFPEKQIESAIWLCQAIQSQNIIRYVLGHSDVAPDRKEDPGELFPWKQLAEEGIGLWPSPPSQSSPRRGEEDRPQGDQEGGRLYDLHKIGYNPEINEKILITAFQRHWVPEAFEAGTAGQVCDLTRKRLIGLLKLMIS